MKKSMVRWLWCMVWLLVGCGNASDVCNEDTSISCTCDTGARGTLSCDDGQLGSCVCERIKEGICLVDAECDDGNFCNGRETCAPDNEDADANGCLVGQNKPFCDDGIECTVDSCDSRLNRCVFDAPDEDGDGHGDASCLGINDEVIGTDCDDSDPNRYPSNIEVCDEDDVDEDCDESTFGMKDLDGDGAVDEACCNGDNCGTDCNDRDIAQRPAQPEFCDNLDNDCDGEVDEQASDVAWYADLDGDGFGDVDVGDVIESCIPIPGRSLLATDCEDAASQRNPAQIEICDLIDNNCNGRADEGPNCGVPQGFPIDPPTLLLGTGGSSSGSGGSTSGSGGSTSGTGGTGGGGTGGTGGGGTGGTGGGTGGSGGTPVQIECDSRDITGATVVTSSIVGNETWSGVVHLQSAVTVGSGDRLIIEPGTLIVADPDTSLTVNGGSARIDWNGTEEAPIKFCGATATAGLWEGIDLNNADPESSVSWLLVADGGGGGVPAALEVTTGITLNHVRVENSGDVGVLASDWGFGSSDLTVTGSVGTAMTLTTQAALADLPLGGTFDGNGEDWVRITHNAWSLSFTIRNLGIPYFLKETLVHSSSSELVIEAGTRFVMDLNKRITFGWNGNSNSVQFLGTAEEPIVFEGRLAAPGYWEGIDFGPNLLSSTTLEHVVVQHAGANEFPALRLRASLPIDGLTLENNAFVALDLVEPPAAGSQGISIALTQGVPISTTGNGSVGIPPDTVMTDNTVSRVEFDTNTFITRAGTLPGLSVPYYLPGFLHLRTGADVTMAAGAEFLLDTAGFVLVGWNGNVARLNIAGTAAAPVVFDHVGGLPGGYEGISYGPNVSPESTIDYLIMRNGGGGERSGMLELGLDDDSDPENLSQNLPAANVTNSTFENSATYGIFLTRNATQDYSGNGNSFSGNASGDIGM